MVHQVRLLICTACLLYAELESLVPQCLHIKAVKALVKTFDTEHQLTPNNFLNGNIKHYQYNQKNWRSLNLAVCPEIAGMKLKYGSG